MEHAKIKILYLYAEVMSYNVSVFREYVQNNNAEVHVVQWDKQKKTPYKAPEMQGVTYYNKSNFSEKSLFDLAQNLKPHLVVTSGWMDKMYVRTCIKIRKLNIPVVAVSDTQYYNSLRQNLGRIYFKFFYKKAFSHLWVAGAYQYEYAKKLGYQNNQIIFNFLSGDLSIFNPIFKNTINDKTKKYPHQFFYAGRFASEKGLDTLLQAWQNITHKKDWTLCLVGNGPLQNQLNMIPNVKVLDFVQTHEFQDLVANSGCFVLPSKMEPWALVLHEFTAAGLPIICSDACGAAPTFVVSGYNGYVFEAGNALDLQHKMQKIIAASDETLLEMSKISHKLGQRIDPETIAKNSLSILIQ